MSVNSRQVVTTESGRVAGREEDGVLAFKGIPFAAPATGKNRFRKPQPAQPWSDVLDAVDYGPVPYQHEMPGAYGLLATPVQPQGADSLLLNVWTPDPDAKDLPVMVWIHGGGYFAGSGSDEMYDGAHFARDGVVCVTINYRLGVEGFLYLDDHFPGFENSGVNGMADQVAALEWVRRNIAGFGGDPDKVTVAGESAGAFSVATLLACPAAKGLFHRAISQSGGAHYVNSKPVASTITAEFLRRAGVTPGDTDALIDLDIGKVIEIQAGISAELMGVPDRAVWGDVPSMANAFKPVVGTDLVPDVPIDAVGKGSAKGIDLLAGWNAEECLIFVKDIADIFDEAMVRGGLDAAMGASGKSGSALFETYKSNRPGCHSVEIAAAAETDKLFRIPTTRLVEAQRQWHDKVYLYRFDWRSQAFDAQMGAYHLSEVPFMFDTLAKPQSKAMTGEAPQALADMAHAAWVAFIKTGVPAAAGLPAWPTYDARRRATMLLDTLPSVADDPAGDERSAWDGVAL